MRSSAERAKAVREKFAPKSFCHSLQIITHSHNILCLDAGEAKANNRLTPDNRAQAETGTFRSDVGSLSSAQAVGAMYVGDTPVQHTLGHRLCPACDLAGSSAMHIQLSPELSFREAAPIWLASRKSISAGSIKDYQKCILRLNSFFGDMCLKDIGIGNLAAYQEQRQLKAGASRINHETMTMGQILKRARLWQPLAEFFEPLPLPKKKRGKALTEQEETRLFEIAASKPKCSVAFWVWTITANTTAGWSEISNLRLRNVDLVGGSVHIEEGIKNEFRERTIPLNEKASEAMTALYYRAKACGSILPDHYLIPDRFGNPNKPMGSCKTAWYSIREDLEKEFPHLAKLRQYDLRHHAITRLLENPEVSEAVAEELAGHISHSMKKLYSHPRMDAKRAAVMALSRRAAAASA